MNIKEFAEQLRTQLAALPSGDVEEAVQYYTESIKDRMEDGLTEEEAVAALGSMDDIVKGITEEKPITERIYDKISESRKKSSNKTLWMVLAIVGSPIWFALAVAALAVVFALYACLWALTASAFAVVFSLVFSGISGIAAGIAAFFTNGVPLALCIIGISLMCLALGLVLIKPTVLAARGSARLTALPFRTKKHKITEKEINK